MLYDSARCGQLDPGNEVLWVIVVPVAAISFGVQQPQDGLRGETLLRKAWSRIPDSCWLDSIIKTAQAAAPAKPASNQPT
jgi:hypothetical protein